MSQTVYTNYWVNRRANIKKEHGSYLTEEEALQGIKIWWEIHKEKHHNVEKKRTNSGALEISYGDDNYFYRIEKRQVSNPLPSRKYKLRSKGEIESLRFKHHLNDESFLYEELAEPYRDRLMIVMADAKKLREYVYDIKGRPIKKFAS